MSIYIQVIEDTDIYPGDHFPGLTCDVCREAIVEHHSALVAWFYGEKELFYVHTEEGCTDCLEDIVHDKLSEDMTMMTDTLSNHFCELLFLLGFEEGSVYPSLKRYEGG